LSSCREPVGSWPGVGPCAPLQARTTKPSAAAAFMLEELERIGTLVGDVDQPRVGRPGGRVPLDP